MRKKIIFLSFVILLSFVFSGCTSKKQVKKQRIFPDPEMTCYYDGQEIHPPGTYYYVVDERTDVVYISYDASKRSSMTVALNADGTPVTKQQLLEELKESKQ